MNLEHRVANGICLGQQQGWTLAEWDFSIGVVKRERLRQNLRGEHGYILGNRDDQNRNDIRLESSIAI